MMPDYDYMLWTDQSARNLIATDYPWFLPVFDAYPHNIQRADAIRYFVLHKYGGIYMDLDIGCNRRLDSLLRFEAIVPKTIPVGVSNDLMFAAKGHPFTVMLIENLARFNHNFLTPYATVMFSTGPMFVSAVYRMHADSHFLAVQSTHEKPMQGFQGVRVLPKSLYGKNAKPEEVPDAFFEHMYGSSWHEGDAGFLIFLRKYGRLLMVIGAAVVAYGLRRFYLGPLLAMFKPVGRWMHRMLALATQGLYSLLDERAAGSEWVPLTEHETEDGPQDTAARPVPLFLSDEPLCVDANAPLPVSTPIARPPSRSNYNDDDAPVFAEHTRRTAHEDAALGSYSKRQEQKRALQTHLPAYYVDGASEYAMDDASLGRSKREDLEQSRARHSFNLSRLRPNWRSLSVAPLKAFVSRPLRRNTEPETDVGDLDNVSVEGGEPLSRRVSSQSDEYHREFASLVQGSANERTDLASPPLAGDDSPSPTVLISEEQDLLTPHHRGAIVRRQPVNDVTRAMTPAVPPIPPAEYVSDQHHLDVRTGL